MDFYLSQNGHRRGPLRVFQVKEMLDRGEAAASDLGWHSGLEEWLPLSEIDAIAPYLPGAAPRRPDPESADHPPPEDPSDDAPEPARPEPLPSHPSPAPRSPLIEGSKWHRFGQRALPRFLARMLDSMLWFSLVCAAGAATGLLPPIAFTFPTLFGFWFVPLQALAWVAVEAWLLSTFGTTPGKWLFNLHLRGNDGALPSFTRALKRAFFIWVFAWGLGHPQWALFGSLISLMLYLQNGRMVWDYLVSTELIHARPRPVAWLVFAAALGLYWAAKTMLMLSQPLPDSLPPALRAQFQEQRATLRKAYRSSLPQEPSQPD